MKKELLLIIAIVVLASFLRLYKLDSFPIGLYSDETSLGYNAYSLLKIGRHFRLPIQDGSNSKGAKLIVGRDQEENNLLLSLAQAEEVKFTVKEFKGALGVLLGEPLPEDLSLSARISARYCQERGSASLIIKTWTNSEDEHQEIEVAPLEDSQIESYRV